MAENVQKKKIFQTWYNQGLVQTRKDFLVPCTDILLRKPTIFVGFIYSFLCLSVPR